MKYTEFIVTEHPNGARVEARQYDGSSLVDVSEEVFPTYAEAQQYGINWCAEKDGE